MSPSQPPKQRAQAVLHPVLHLGYLPVTLLLTPIRQLAMYMCNHVKFSFDAQCERQLDCVNSVGLNR